jgi:hypothetical protein
MATIASIEALEGMTTAAFTATASGGDQLTCETGKPLLIEFHNTAGSAVTATITPVVANVGNPQIGAATKSAITQSIPANSHRVVEIPAAVLPLYQNASGRVAITYASHDVGLLVRGIIV